MIQEIYDYLSIRSNLTNYNSKQLIELAKDPDTFRYYIKNISKLMQEEDYLLTSWELMKGVEDLLQAYRFDFIKEKEINEKMNYMIGRLQDYRNLSPKRHLTLINRWIQEERKNRGFPFYCDQDELYFQLISLDEESFFQIFSLESHFEIKNPLAYLSLVHLLIEKFPEVWEDEILLGYNRSICEICSKIAPHISVEKVLAKKVLHKWNKRYGFKEEFHPSYTYTLKKKKEN